MRIALRYSIAVAIGAALGLGSAWWALALMPDGERYGVWQTDALTGSRAAGAYTRARIARHGLLALNADEALYLWTTQDEHGEPLRENCDYDIRGGMPAAQWWSLTLYAEDEFLPGNGDGAYTLDPDSVQYDTDDTRTWHARLAPARGDAANWLSTRDAGRYSLVLRLYRRSAAPQAQSLPTIGRVSCT